MKRPGRAALGVLGIWCAFTSFISPIWLGLTLLYLSGRIYQFDGMLDKGTAGILGIVLLLIWILAVLLSDIFLLQIMWKHNHKYLFIALAMLLLFAVLCMAMCGFHVTAFLNEPGAKFGFWRA